MRLFLFLNKKLNPEAVKRTPHSVFSFLLSGGSTCQCAASEGPHAGAQAVRRNSRQQPGEPLAFLYLCKISKILRNSHLVLPLMNRCFEHVFCLCVCSFSSSNWQKWPPSWWHLGFWCVKPRLRYRRAGRMRFLSAPWPSSLSRMSALM